MRRRRDRTVARRLSRKECERGKEETLLTGRSIANDAHACQEESEPFEMETRNCFSAILQVDGTGDMRPRGDGAIRLPVKAEEVRQLPGPSVIRKEGEEFCPREEVLMRVCVRVNADWYRQQQGTMRLRDAGEFCGEKRQRIRIVQLTIRREADVIECREADHHIKHIRPGEREGNRRHDNAMGVKHCRVKRGSELAYVVKRDSRSRRDEIPMVECFGTPHIKQRLRCQRFELALEPRDFNRSFGNHTFSRGTW